MLVLFLNETMMVKIVSVLLVVHLACKAIIFEILIVTLKHETMMVKNVFVLLFVQI